MTEIWTIYGGDMWRQVFNGVVTVLGADTFTTLLRIVSMFGVLGVAVTFVKTRNPLVFLHYLAVFMLITSALLVPKRSVQIHDITDPAAVYQVDNVPVGLAMIAGLSTGAGYGVAQLYDYVFARPDSLTYTKTGMLFGSQVIAQTTDFRTQNPELSQMLTDYVENCVVGDILLNNKYTIAQLLNSTDPLTLITNNPSPLRGLYQDAGGGRQFITCQQAAAVIKNLIGADVRIGGTTWHQLATRVFGNRVNADALLGNAMDESYNFFYAGGLSAAQIMRNNITNAAVRDGWKGFAARSSDTANLVNLATESSMTKQRLSWASFGSIMGRMLPMFQSLLMLILIALFPLMIALALTNHTIFGLNTLKIYAGGFLYFQMWPVMYAILNSLANFYLQSKTGTTALVLSNQDQVALQHSDAANIAGYLSASIPALSFYLTKGAGAIASQVAGSVISSAAFSTGGQASTTADGNWSFNNMSMDNVNANKFDTNMMHRSGSQSLQTGNGAMHTQTADGHNVYDTSGAVSTLPVNMRLSALASSGYSEQARQAQQQAQSSLDGYNHSVTSGFQQLHQLTTQTGNSDSVTQGSDSSVATNVSRGASKMQSAVESYAKSHNVSEQQAYNKLMDISNQGSAGTGIRGQVKFDSGDQLAGKLGKWATGVSAGGEASVNADWRHSSGSSHGTQDTNAEGRDHRQDQSSQEARDFREGMDMITSTRLSESGNHTDNQSNSQVQQFAATLNDAKSQYHQYTESSTRSQELSRMATLSQTQSASLDANYNQEFVDWTTAKYGSDAQNILTNVKGAEGAAMEFMHERLEPQIMKNYVDRTDQVNSEPLQPTRSLNGPGIPQNGDAQIPASVPISEQNVPAADSSGSVTRGTARTNGNSGSGYELSAERPANLSSRATETHINNSERNISAPSGDPSQAMKDDFRSGEKRVSEQAAGAGIQSNVADMVAAQRSGLMETVRENDGKIAENKNTVQASSDILRNEHQGAVRNQQVGRTEEDLRQTKPIGDSAEIKDFKDKLEKLRSEQRKAS
ncbi:conjugal transfer mating-pair stabilization protein TraG [Pantoea agglomerans]|nr:conjugal transfer mating-pair stabilization protein TraG [Pantoea agglomerans]WNK33432.1 conjugal transfer mating-pair stabilization protein TraG [Pantoea agglomerans]WNK60662.1 conjugal transfer mating-pair stabilization protein TraG [Pantoea agglomerans]WNK65049.1 conjugal transfer mating-pair stabilization protein TraG [Pantoea agglomerans]